MRLFAIQFLLSIVLVAQSFLTTGCLAARDEWIIKMRPHAEPMARHFQTRVPPPVWQIDTDLSGLDEVVYLSKDRVLVGHTNIEGFNPRVKEPVARSLVVYDINTAKPIWTYERQGDSTEHYSILAYFPVVLIRHGDPKEDTVYTGLDPLNGQVRWRQTASKQSLLSKALNPFISIISDVDDETLTLRALELENGHKQWEISLPIPEDSGMPEITIDSLKVLVCAQELSALDLDTGRRLWSHKLGRPHPLLSVIMLGNKVAYLSKDNKLTLINNNGQVKWSKTLPPGEVKAVTPNTSTLYLNLSSPNRVLAVQLDNGQIAWNLSTGQSSIKTLVVDDHQLFLSLDNSIQKIEAQSGQLMGTLELPETFHLNRLPDHLKIIQNNHLIVASETAVASIDIGDWKFAWLHEMPHTHSGTLAQRRHQLKETLQEFSETTGTTEPEIEDAIRKTRQNTDSYIRTAQSLNQIIEFNHNFGPSQREWIKDMEDKKIFSKEAAIANLKSTQKIERHLALSSVVYASSQAMLKMVAMIQHMFVQGRIKMAQHAIFNAIALHERSIQGDYFVRPFNWLYAKGVFVVNLRDGSWSEIITGPSKKYAYTNFIEFPYAAISNDGKQLVTKDSGLDVQKWRDDERFYEFRDIHRFVMLYKTSFKPANDFPVKSIIQ